MTPSAERALDRVVRSTLSWVSSPSQRSEIGWVVLAKCCELVLVFALLKVLSNRIGSAGFGEYHLADTAVFFVTSFLLTPVHEAYLRDFHGSAEREERRAAGVFLLRWYAIVTIAVALTAALLSTVFAEWFEVGSWTPLAAGLIFLFDRWRWLGQDVLNIQRKRRTWALTNIFYYTTQFAAISAAVSFGPATATTALIAYAAVSALFSIIVAGPLLRDIASAPRGRPSGLPRLAIVYGAPFAAVLVFQWIQTFGDRYLIKALLDASSVGLYVAAYQVCGIPFALASNIAHHLLTPIAFQRSRELRDSAQLWSADRLIIAGILAQVVVGVFLLGCYALFGRDLLILSTNEQFELPTRTLVVLAGARFTQSLAQSMQPIFAVHHHLHTMLWFRGLGAALTLAVCWPMIARYGIAGAAGATCIAFTAYLAMVVFAPAGVWGMVSDARRRAIQAGSAAR